jgi:enoyl-CoA hydratase/carnithine racemase
VVLRVGADEFIDRLVHGDRDALADAPLVAVDCSSPSSAVPDGVEELLAGLPAVVVALGGHAGGPLVDAVDLRLEDPTTLDAVAAAVAANPQAAVSLAAHLRGHARRSISEGLVAESATYAALQSGSEHRRWRSGRPSPPASAAEERDVVLLERRGNVLTVTLNRPARRNALNAAMRDALIEALTVAAVDPTLRVELTGRGTVFCSGGDLTEFGTMADGATAHLLRLRRNVALVLAPLAERVEARVHGPCVGAGVELPAFAHRVVAAPGTTFSLPEVSMGLIPGAGGTVSLPRRIGRQRTLLLALLGLRLDAETARRWGLIDEIVTAPAPGEVEDPPLL